MTTLSKAQELGLTPLAKIKTIVKIGNDPKYMDLI
jgi:acetyl-CoA acetyltransferase